VARLQLETMVVVTLQSDGGKRQQHTAYQTRMESFCLEKTTKKQL